MPDQHEVMGKVMHCESRGVVDAQNPHSSAAGLFQITRGSWRWARTELTKQGIIVPRFIEGRYQAIANIFVASWLLLEGGGLRHWEASRNCWK